MKKPLKRRNVLDLLNELKFDTKDWYQTSGPPASNPKYCYNWVHPDKGSDRVVFILWYDELQEEDQRIFCIKDKEKSFQKKASPKEYERRVAFYNSLDILAKSNKPFRVIIYTREYSPSSKKNVRDLDSRQWKVEKRDNVFRLYRLQQSEN